MQVLTIINQKGGVGKTTTVINFGHGLALGGHRVLLVDLDPQGHCADSLGIEKHSGLYRLLIENAGRAAITPTGRDGLDVVTGDDRSVEAGLRLSSDPFGVYVLREQLERLDGYDVAILDVAPSLNLLQAASLVAADAFLIPVKLAQLSVVGSRDVLATAQAIKRRGGLDARFIGILPTFYERRTNETVAQLKKLYTEFGSLAWRPIPDDTRVREASAHGQTLYEFAPATRALQLEVSVNGTDKTVMCGYRFALLRLIQELGL